MTINNELWIATALALAVGFLVGFLVAYFGVYKRRKAAKLQAELLEQKAQLAAYREKVDAHFVATSAKFQGLTEQYRALYEHLADGAQNLCTDRLLAQQLGVIESRPLVEQRKAGGAAAETPPGEDALATSQDEPVATTPDETSAVVEPAQAEHKPPASTQAPPASTQVPPATAEPVTEQPPTQTQDTDHPGASSPKTH